MEERNSFLIDSLILEAERESAWKELDEAYKMNYTLLTGTEIEDMLESIQEYAFLENTSEGSYDVEYLFKALDSMSRIATYLAGIVVHNRPDEISYYVTKHLVNCIAYLKMAQKKPGDKELNKEDR